MTIEKPKCFDCIHFNQIKLTCKAFPDQIPYEILEGDDHDQVRNDQIGDYVYKKRDL